MGHKSRASQFAPPLAGDVIREGKDRDGKISFVDEDYVYASFPDIPISVPIPREMVHLKGIEGRNVRAWRVVQPCQRHHQKEHHKEHQKEHQQESTHPETCESCESSSSAESYEQLEQDHD